MNQASPPTLSATLTAIRSQLLELTPAAVISTFGLQPTDALLKTTISLCPTCLAHVPAVVFTRDSRVLMRKTCVQHGVSEAVVENDDSYYHLSNKDSWGRCYAKHRVMDFPQANSCCGGGGCCGDSDEPEDEFDEDDITPQMGNKSCTILVEITNACNLACAVCYSDSRGDRKLPADAFKAHLQRLIEEKGLLDSVQITGGEAILHPEFWDMVAFLHALPVKKIYLPTNGLLFAREENAQRLAPFKDKLMVLLQFDGQPETNRAIRNANPGTSRDKVIANLARLGIHMQLTMTLSSGVNEQEVGWVVETAMRHRHIKVVALQPATYSGRYDLTCDPLRRLTLSDCVKAVAAQMPKRVREDDFKPIPCSHPNCGWITLFVQRFGLTRNIARHIDLEAAMPTAANRTLLDSGQLRSIIGTTRGTLLERIGHWAGRKLVRSTDVFAVAIKPFMDRFNYDQDRISACCHHLLDTEGRPVSFCEYNARIRQQDSWSKFPKLNPAAS